MLCFVTLTFAHTNVRSAKGFPNTQKQNKLTLQHHDETQMRDRLHRGNHNKRKNTVETALGPWKFVRDMVS